MTQDFVSVAVLLRELTVQSESNTAQANNRRSAGAYIAALPPLGAVRGKELGPVGYFLYFEDERVLRCRRLR